MSQETIIRVTQCEGCPFSDTVDSAGHPLDLPTCQAPGMTGDGALFDDEVVPMTPPDWCPLRESWIHVALA